MPDIQLRFQRDMLVLSAPVDELLARQGINAALDREYLNLMEPDSIRDALKMEVMAGAQCVVTTTEDITQARLAHLRMDDDAGRLAAAALAIANEVKPQHVLAEVGPCGLPLDASSKSSLNENRAQYADAARAFAGGVFDAFFLNGFTSLADLKCALMGVAQVADKPVFASVSIGSAPAAADAGMPGGGEAPHDDRVLKTLPFSGYELPDHPVGPPASPSQRGLMRPENWPEAIEVMVDLGASVIGFETPDPLEQALAYARAAVERTELPVLAQLRLRPPTPGGAGKNLVPLHDLKEYTPDTLGPAAVKLYGAGVQFLRATGVATPACTGALAAVVTGLDVHRG